MDIYRYYSLKNKQLKTNSNYFKKPIDINIISCYNKL